LIAGQLQVFDINGSLITTLHQNQQDHLVWNIQNIPAGTYILKADHGKNQATSRILINR